MATTRLQLINWIGQQRRWIDGWMSQFDIHQLRQSSSFSPPPLRPYPVCSSPSSAVAGGLFAAEAPSPTNCRLQFWFIDWLWIVWWIIPRNGSVTRCVCSEQLKLWIYSDSIYIVPGNEVLNRFAQCLNFTWIRIQMMIFSETERSQDSYWSKIIMANRKRWFS